MPSEGKFEQPPSAPEPIKDPASDEDLPMMVMADEFTEKEVSPEEPGFQRVAGHLNEVVAAAPPDVSPKEHLVQYVDSKARPVLTTPEQQQKLQAVEEQLRKTPHTTTKDLVNQAVIGVEQLLRSEFTPAQLAEQLQTVKDQPLPVEKPKPSQPTFDTGYDPQALPQPIADPSAHLEKVKLDTNDTSWIDRSTFFRYKQDARAVSEKTRENIKQGQPTSMLLIGVGNGEEPLSYLAAAQAEASKNNQPLSQTVDLHLVELRPKEQVTVKYELGKMIEGGVNLAFVPEKDKAKFPMVPRTPPQDLEAAYQFNQGKGEFVFHSDIQAVLENTMADPKRAHFATPIENYLSEQADTSGKFDIVAFNNVAQHLGGTEGYANPFKNLNQDPKEYGQFAQVIRGVMKQVRPGGLLVMHTDGVKSRAYSPALQYVPEFDEQFEETAKGIFRRK